MERLETDRLIMREWDINDAYDVYEYAKSKKVGPMAGWKPHESVEETKKIIEMFIEENETWAIYSKELKKVIGSIGMHNTDKENQLELGYVLAEECWGQGLMVEASKAVIKYGFDNLGLDNIYVGHFSYNKQSKRVIEKLGFRYIETKEKSYKIYDGSMVDDVCYLLSKEEFKAEGVLQDDIK